MSYVEQMLRKAVEHGVIEAYAINGPWIEINTGLALVKADAKGALEELKQMSPELFKEDEIVAAEVPSVEKPKRKRTTKASR